MLSVDTCYSLQIEIELGNYINYFNPIFNSKLKEKNIIENCRYLLTKLRAPKAVGSKNLEKSNEFWKWKQKTYNCRSITEQTFLLAIFLVYFSDGFVIYSHAIWNEKKKILNVRMIHTIYRTQCSFGNRYTKFQCKSWMNKRSLWTNALYHIMSNRIANSLTISTLLVRNSIGYRNWCCCCIYHTFTNCTKSYKL